MPTMRAVQVAKAGGEFPLEKASEGYERMLGDKARFRVVLIIGH
jgi:hypothetical protein